MTVAAPVWNDMISPVLDTARMLRVYEVSDGMPGGYTEYPLPDGAARKAEVIAGHASVLICGALSGELAEGLRARGVNVHPWIMGEAAVVIAGFAVGNIHLFEYSMPGCHRRRNGCGRGQRHGRHGSRRMNGA